LHVSFSRVLSDGAVFVENNPLWEKLEKRPAD